MRVFFFLALLLIPFGFSVNSLQAAARVALPTPASPEMENAGVFSEAQIEGLRQACAREDVSRDDLLCSVLNSESETLSAEPVHHGYWHAPPLYWGPPPNWHRPPPSWHAPPRRIYRHWFICETRVGDCDVPRPGPCSCQFGRRVFRGHAYLD